MSRQGPGPRAAHLHRAAQPRGEGGRVVLWLMLGIAALLLVGYATLCFVAGDKVPPGASVAGVDIGGLPVSAAENRLRADLGPRSRQPITVHGGGLSDHVDPAKAGLAVDVRGSVQAAGGGRSFAPARLWHYFTGGETLDARLDVDGGRLEDAVSELAYKVDRSPVDGGIVFEKGKPVVTSAADGRRLARGGTRDALAGAFLGSAPAELPVTVLPPTVTDEAVQRALVTFARPATSAPVVLVLDGHEVRAAPERFARALTMQADASELVASLDVDTLLTALAPAMTTVAGTPQPARIVLVGGRPKVLPAKIGVAFDPDDLRRKFLASVVKPKGERRVNVRGVSARPSFTTAHAHELKVVERVSTFRTRFPYAEYRNVNLSRAAQLVDGALLRPGDTFSLNHAIGRPSVDRGFTSGYVISDGIFKEDLGGGISQLATTMYNAMFFAGLDDVEHEVHSVHLDRFPVGREATLAYGKQDLRFNNDSPYGVLVTASVTPSSQSTEGTVTVTMWSTKHWDVTARASNRYAKMKPRIRHRHGASCEAAVGYPGFSVDVLRIFRKPGSATVDHQEKTTSVYDPSSTVVCDSP
ncbi:MAG: VanW family protein [Marmoricola sp.]